MPHSRRVDCRRARESFLHGYRLAQVSRGAVEAGFVYRTDALKSKGVRVVLGVPADAHDPIVYPAAVVKRSGQAELAGRFVDFLASENGQKILAKFGFQPAS